MTYDDIGMENGNENEPTQNIGMSTKELGWNSILYPFQLNIWVIPNTPFVMSRAFESYLAL